MASAQTRGVCDLCRSPLEGESAALSAARLGHKACLIAACATRPEAVHDVSRRQGSAGVLHLAAEHGHTDLLRWLYDETSADVDACDVNGASATHIAAAHGQLACIRYLVGVAGMDVNGRARNETTPLMVACQNGHDKTVEWLLGPGRASLLEKNSQHVSAVHLAAAQGQQACLKHLTKHRQYKPNELTKDKTTPAYFAAQEGRLECLKWLVDHGNVDLKLANDEGHLPIHAAASNGHLACLEFLVSTQGKLTTRSSDGGTPLHFAAAAGQAECVRWIAEKLGSANKLDRDKNGGTAIHDAAENDQLAVVKFFIDNEYDVDARDDEGRTPLDLAKECNNEEMVDLILEARLPPLLPANIQLSRPRSAIIKAANRPRRHKNSSTLDGLGLSKLPVQQEEKDENAEDLAEIMPPKGFTDIADEATRLALLEVESSPAPAPESAQQMSRQSSAAVLPLGGDGAEGTDSGKKKKRRAKGLSQVKPGDDVFDLSASSPAVMSDDDSRQKKGGKFSAFFSNLKRRTSSQQSLGSDVGEPLSPTISEGSVTQKKKKQGRKFGIGKMMHKHKQRTQSSSSLDGDSTDWCVVPPGSGPDAAGGDTRLERMLTLEDDEDAGQPSARLKPVPETETEEEVANRKRREFEELMLSANVPAADSTVQVLKPGDASGESMLTRLLQEAEAAAKVSVEATAAAAAAKKSMAPPTAEVETGDSGITSGRNVGDGRSNVSPAGGAPQSTDSADKPVAVAAIQKQIPEHSPPLEVPEECGSTGSGTPGTALPPATAFSQVDLSPDKGDGNAGLLSVTATATAPGTIEHTGRGTTDQAETGVQISEPDHPHSPAAEQGGAKLDSGPDTRQHEARAVAAYEASVTDARTRGDGPTLEQNDAASTGPSQSVSRVSGDGPLSNITESIQTPAPEEHSASPEEAGGSDAPASTVKEDNVDRTEDTGTAESVADGGGAHDTTAMEPVTNSDSGTSCTPDQAIARDAVCAAATGTPTAVEVPGEPLLQSGLPASLEESDSSTAVTTVVVKDTEGNAKQVREHRVEEPTAAVGAEDAAGAEKPPVGGTTPSVDSAGSPQLIPDLDTNESEPQAALPSQERETLADSQNGEAAVVDSTKAAPVAQEAVCSSNSSDPASPVEPYTETKGDRRPSTVPLQNLSDNQAKAKGGEDRDSKHEEAELVLKAFKAKKEAEQKAKLANQDEGDADPPTPADMQEQPGTPEDETDGGRKRSLSMSQRLGSYIKRRKSSGRDDTPGKQQPTPLEEEDDGYDRNRTGTVVVRDKTQLASQCYDAIDEVGSEAVTESVKSARLSGSEDMMSPFMAVNQEHMTALEEVENERASLARQAATALTAIPAISGDAVPAVFQGSGLLAGLELWRLTKGYRLEPEAVNDDTALGMDELYLCLYTKAAIGLKHVIHLWLGKDTPQEAYQALLGHAHSLEQSLGGIVIIQRETQGHESANFLSYFDHGLLCHKDANSDRLPRLLHVQGRRHLSITEVDISSKSLNKGDGFLLLTNEKILVWMGPGCEEKHRRKVLKLADWMAERRGGLPVRNVDDGIDSTAKVSFWNTVGSRTSIKQAQLGRGVHRVDRKKQRLRLFIVLGSGEKGKLKIMEKKAKALEWRMLPTDGTAVVETDGCMYVWNGRQVITRDVRLSFQRCDIVTRSRGLSSWAPVVRIRQHGEPAHFKDFFQEWPMVNTSTLAELCGTSSLLIQPETMVDKGTNLAKVFTTHRAQLTEVPPRRHNQFSSTESYVVKYTYRRGGGTARHVLYTWHGAECSSLRSTQTMAAAAALAKTLDCPPAQIRISQGFETDHFLSIFKGQLVVFKSAQRSEITNEPKLFCVSGKSSLKACVTQVPCKASSLQSRHAFCLITPRASFIWGGKGSSQVERRAATAALRLLDLALKSPVRCLEGEEPDLFWQLLGGRLAYDMGLLSLKPDPHAARLYHTCLFGGRLVTEEVFNVSQGALTREDVLLMDVGNQIFMWIGEAVSAEERQNMSKMAVDYLASDQSGRKPESVTSHFVQQNFEPATFTSHFHYWDARFWDQEPASIEAVVKEVTGKRASLRRSQISPNSSSSSLQSVSESDTTRAQSNAMRMAASDLPEIASGVELDRRHDDDDDDDDDEDPATGGSAEQVGQAGQEGVTAARTDSPLPAQEPPLSNPDGMSQQKAAEHGDQVLSESQPTGVGESTAEGKPEVVETAGGAVGRMNIPSAATPKDSSQVLDTAVEHTLTAASGNFSELSETGDDHVREHQSNVPHIGHGRHGGHDGNDEDQVDGDIKPDKASSPAIGSETEVDQADNAMTAEDTPASDDGIGGAGHPTIAVDHSTAAGAQELAKSGIEQAPEVVKETDNLGMSLVLDTSKDNRAPDVNEAIEPASDKPQQQQDKANASPEIAEPSATGELTPAEPEVVVADEDVDKRWERMAPDAPMSQVVTSAVPIASSASSLAVPGAGVGAGASATPSSSLVTPAISSISLSASNLLAASSSLLLDSNFDLDNLDTIPESLNTLPRRPEEGKEAKTAATAVPAISSSSSSSKSKSKPAKATPLAASENRTISVVGLDKKQHAIELTPRSNAQQLVYKMVTQLGMPLSITLSVVEALADLQLERRLEDHEKVLDVVGRWPARHGNALHLRDAPSKYALFEKPQLPRPVLLAACDRSIVPDISGFMWLKSPAKLTWEQHVVVLHAKGIAFSSAESDGGDNDPSMAVLFQGTNIYLPTGGQRASGAPTKFSFVVKGTRPETTHVQAWFCAHSAADFVQWIAGIRLVTFGGQLRKNHAGVRQQFSMLVRMKKARKPPVKAPADQGAAKK